MKRERREADRLRVRTCLIVFLDKLDQIIYDNRRLKCVYMVGSVWVVLFGDARVVRTVQAAKRKNARRASMASECVEAKMPSTRATRQSILKIREFSVSE